MVSQRRISCTPLASQHLLAILWPGCKSFPLRPWRRLSGMAEVSRVGVLRPPQPLDAVRRGFALDSYQGRLSGDDAISLGVRQD